MLVTSYVHICMYVKEDFLCIPVYFNAQCGVECVRALNQGSEAKSRSNAGNSMANMEIVY